jgi:hypothetical protein
VRSTSPLSRSEAFEHGADALQAAVVDVVQDDLLQPQPLLLVQQRAVDERNPEPASSDDRQFHGETSSPKSP